MRNELKKRVRGLEDVYPTKTAEELLIGETADSIEAKGIDYMIKVMRLLDRETPLDGDGCPCPWHRRRIQELRSKENLTLKEREELQGYIEKRRLQDALLSSGKSLAEDNGGGESWR